MELVRLADLEPAGVDARRPACCAARPRLQPRRTRGRSHTQVRGVVAEERAVGRRAVGLRRPVHNNVLVSSTSHLEEGPQRPGPRPPHCGVADGLPGRAAAATRPRTTSLEKRGRAQRRAAVSGRRPPASLGTLVVLLVFIVVGTKHVLAHSTAIKSVRTRPQTRGAMPRTMTLSKHPTRTRRLACALHEF